MAHAANNYYVTTTGDDRNPGTQTAPFASINKAASVAQPGDTVHVLPGDYIAAADASGLFGIRSTTNGTAAARIRYVSDVRWGARILSSGAYHVWYNSGDYVDIEGFEIVGDSAANVGINNAASFVRILGNKVHGIPTIKGCSNSDGGAGIDNSNYAGSDDDIVGNVVFDIGPLPPDGLPLASYCNLAQGIYSSNLRGRIENNIVYRVAAFGITLWHAANNVVVCNNLSFNNGARTNRGAYMGGGMVVGAGDSPGGVTMDNTMVANNIITGNRGRAFEATGRTGYGNRFLNNLVSGNGTDHVSAQTFALTGTVVTDPQLVNFQLNGAGDYHLKSSSPAIDAGTAACAASTSPGVPSADFDGVSRPQGSAWDIGPYEYRAQQLQQPALRQPFTPDPQR